MMSVSRRAVLIGLATSTPLASSLSSIANAAGDDTNFLKVSRIIVGRDDINPKLAQRIFDVLSSKIDGFKDKLSSLASALGDGQNRDAALGALDDANLNLALSIAQPWYTGVSGIGDEHSFEDDAVFVTFLGAVALQSVAKSLPLQSYPPGGPGWWAQAPEGVTPPPMPDGIQGWDYVPPGANRPFAKADSEFLALVMSSDPYK